MITIIIFYINIFKQICFNILLFTVNAYDLYLNVNTDVTILYTYI